MCGSVSVFCFLVFCWGFFVGGGVCIRSVRVWNDVRSIPDEDLEINKVSNTTTSSAFSIPPTSFFPPPLRTYMRGKRDTSASYPRNTTRSFYSPSLFFSLSFSSLLFSLTNFILRRPYLSPPSFLSAKSVLRQRLT